MRLAQRFAIENPNVRADMIEVTEFPEVASKYSVYAVPKTVINEQAFIEGALPERQFLETILSSLSSGTEPAPSAGTP